MKEGQEILWYLLFNWSPFHLAHMAKNQLKWEVNHFWHAVLACTSSEQALSNGVGHTYTACLFFKIYAFKAAIWTQNKTCVRKLMLAIGKPHYKTRRPYLGIARKGGCQPLPEWPVASIVALKIDAKSAPECPFECGGVRKLRAMPKCPLREFQWCFPYTLALSW